MRCPTPAPLRSCGDHPRRLTDFEASSLQQFEQMKKALEAEDTMAASVFDKTHTFEEHAASTLRSERTINVEKIKLSAAVARGHEARKDKLAKLQDNADKLGTKIARIVDDPENPNRDNATKCAKDLKDNLKKAIDFLDGSHKKDLDDIGVLGSAAESISAVTDCKTRLSDALKSQTKGVVSEFYTFSRLLNVTLVSMARKADGDKQCAKRKLEQSRAKAPLWVILFESFSPNTCGTSESVFEAKGGIRAALLKCSSDAGFARLLSTPLVKKVSVAFMLPCRRASRTASIRSSAAGRCSSDCPSRSCSLLARSSTARGRCQPPSGHKKCSVSTSGVATRKRCRSDGLPSA